MTGEIEAFAATWDQSFSAGDFAKLKSFYADTARIIPSGGQPVEGREGIAAFFADIRAKGLTKHTIDVQSIIARGDTAIASGGWSLNGANEAGEAQKFGGNWVNVLGRDGDSWKILLHTWN
ncbi:MAG TPA: DUF4440 domain-containing protein [Hyphomicrobium sp.]|nr:DUF4440 domain-containing protein [Hyphomicrobium sp.]